MYMNQSQPSPFCVRALGPCSHCDGIRLDYTMGATMLLFHLRLFMLPTHFSMSKILLDPKRNSKVGILVENYFFTLEQALVGDLFQSGDCWTVKIAVKMV